MRVLTVGNMYPPLSLGGYELAWRSSVEQLRSRGQAARVLTTDYGLDRRPAPEGPEVFRELRWYWREHDWPRLGLRERVALERHNAAVMRRHLGAFRPDVVAWWAMGGMSLSLIELVRRHGVPAAGVVCDDWLLYGPSVDQWTRIFRGRRRLAAPIVERLTGLPARVDLAAVGPVLFASATLRDRALAGGVELPRAEVGLRGVERDLFAAAPRPEWRWRLLFVGRIDSRKGIDLAVEALRSLPDAATLTVVGDGDAAYLGELQRLAGEPDLDGRVSFTRSDRDRLQQVYADADAVMFPVRWDEPWGLVPLEAMTVGVPVIASGRGGSAEYLRDRRNCLIFDPDAGPGALAAAVRELGSDPALRERLREGGFETSAGLSVEAYDEAIEALLADVAGGFGGAASG
jgi:glycosyltransferase involved in cell wall biosynthesis